MKRIRFCALSAALAAALAMPVSMTAPRAALIEHQGQEIFLSGINLAWINFGRDLESFDEQTFFRAVREVAAIGGNTLRWWLHTNGSQTPTYDAQGKVAGISPAAIANMKRALDLEPGQTHPDRGIPRQGSRRSWPGFRPKSPLTTAQAYRWALESGYAGALSWTRTNHDGFGGIEETAPGLRLLREIYPDLVTSTTAGPSR